MIPLCDWFAFLSLMELVTVRVTVVVVVVLFVVVVVVRICKNNKIRTFLSYLANLDQCH